MATFLYYAADTFVPAIVKHLAGVTDGGTHQQQVLRGPDNGCGTLVCAKDRLEPGRLKYRPHEQTWRLVGAAGRPAYWIGTFNDDPPTPNDLVRKKTIPGHETELADGRLWLCPVARGQAAQDGRLVWYHTLPRTIVLDEESDRQWTEGKVVPRYARLWELAGQYWQARVGSAMPEASAGEQVKFDFQGDAAAAALCLAVNYRVTSVEVSDLGLLDTDAPRKILDALIDWPTLIKLSAEMQKKTACEANAG
jgi:hypothetical protein